MAKRSTEDREKKGTEEGGVGAFECQIHPSTESGRKRDGSISPCKVGAKTND